MTWHTSGYGLARRDGLCLLGCASGVLLGPAPHGTGLEVVDDDVDVLVPHSSLCALGEGAVGERGGEHGPA